MTEKVGNRVVGRLGAAHRNPQSAFAQATADRPSTLNSQLSTLNRKRAAFTLIELLIVTVVIVALMSITFRLAGIVGSTTERERTIARMQRLENCLSGYYAAFGQYPPVPLQGASHNIFRRACPLHQIQYGEERDTELSAVNVRAACRAQPVAAQYPPAKKTNGYDDADDLVDAYKSAVNEFYSVTASGSGANPKQTAWEGSVLGYGHLYTSGKKEFLGTSDFTRFQMFRFGLMSFLLPRYRFMLESARSGGYFSETIDTCKQWTDFNILPARMDSGISYMSWGNLPGSGSRFIDLLTARNNGADETKRWEIDLIPSQAACARWMPNLEGIVSGPSNSFFGVLVSVDSDDIGIPTGFSRENEIIVPFGLGDHGDTCESGNPYILFSMTVKDGWGNDFYYYSPPPYQSYILWSSGAYDDNTFPPWIDLSDFRGQYGEDFYKKALEWSQDDIVFMGTGEKR